MICVSIANESRRLAVADMLTAARQGDLLEVRLDRFDKAPDLKDLLAARRKPVILTCRRVRDGGDLPPGAPAAGCVCAVGLAGSDSSLTRAFSSSFTIPLPRASPTRRYISALPNSWCPWPGLGESSGLRTKSWV
jgi:hypothetical protein